LHDRFGRSYSEPDNTDCYQHYRFSAVLWISGRLLAGKDKAKFTDALWIVVLGTVIGGVFQYLFAGIIAAIVVLFIWLALVKYFFDTGWLRALVIAVVAILIWIVIAVIIGLIVGVTIIGGGLLV
jgi:hypothetical protein